MWTYVLNNQDDADGYRSEGKIGVRGGDLLTPPSLKYEESSPDTLPVFSWSAFTAVESARVRFAQSYRFISVSAYPLDAGVRPQSPFDVVISHISKAPQIGYVGNSLGVMFSLISCSDADSAWCTATQRSTSGLHFLY
jgi:hypothetical protein